jgi:hypothetical protein
MNACIYQLTVDELRDSERLGDEVFLLLGLELEDVRTLLALDDDCLK